MSIHRACCCQFCVFEEVVPGKVYRSGSITLSGFSTLECNGCYFSGTTPDFITQLYGRFTAFASLNGTYDIESHIEPSMGTEFVYTCDLRGEHTVTTVTWSRYLNDPFGDECDGDHYDDQSHSKLIVRVVFQGFISGGTGDNQNMIATVLIYVADAPTDDATARFQVFSYDRTLDTEDRYAGDTLTNNAGVTCGQKVLFGANGTVVVNL